MLPWYRLPERIPVLSLGGIPFPNSGNYALSDGRQYWKAGQVLQCVDGAFCQPMPQEMVDQGMPFGPRYVSVEQLAEQARSIRPALKRVEAMKMRDELDAPGRITSLEAVKAELFQRQAEVDAELARLLERVSLEEEPPAKNTLDGILIDRAFGPKIC